MCQKIGKAKIDTVQDICSLRIVTAPKTEGAYTMAMAMVAQPVLAWTMFSSITALTGTPGQANYAAANMQLNEVSKHHRNAGDYTHTTLHP